MSEAGSCPSCDMTDVAAKAATTLRALPGVDGVFVMILRRSDNSMGGAVAGDIPYDSLCACTMQLLGMLRHEMEERGTQAHNGTPQDQGRDQDHNQDQDSQEDKQTPS